MPFRLSRAVTAAAVVLAAWALLRLGALGGAPELVRLGVSFAALVILPGAAWLALGLAPRGGWLISAPLALGLGVAWNALLVLATRALGLRFTVLIDAAPLLALALVALAGMRASRRAAAESAAPSETLRGAAAIAVAVAALLAGLHAGRIGTPVSYFSDSPDHIGTIRRMLETGDAFPRDAFFRDAGPEGADPRKGLWHPQVALIAGAARVDPADAWRRLPALIAPFFVLVIARLGALSAGAAGAAVFAWVQLLILAGSLRWFPLEKAVFSTFLADQLCLATAIAALADALRPSRSGRLTVIGLTAGAVTCHLYSVIQLALTLGALAVGLALRDRRVRGQAARVAGTALLAALTVLPFVIWRASVSYAPVNVIHTEPQGLLILAGNLRMVSPGVLWDWMGGLFVLFPIAWIPLWRSGRHDPAALFVLTTSLSVVLVMFNPLAVAVLEPRIGYLLMRMVWMLPIGALIAWSGMRLVADLRVRGLAAWRSGIALAGLAVIVLPTALDAAAGFARPGRFDRADRSISPLRWRAGLEWLDRSLPAGQVVLSDPATSYGVPMLTRHYVATLVDQHSSPSDSLALTRILDARDALDPFGGWERTRAVIRRWGVTVVIVNGDFPDAPPLDFWAPSRAWAAAARSRLEREPAVFERVYDRDGFTVFRVHADRLDSLDAPVEPRPFVVPFVPGRTSIGRRYAEDLPVIHRLTLVPTRVARGDTLRGVAEWRALSALPGGAYRVSMRYERALPAGFSPPAMIAKPARKVLEKLRRERYRFRTDHLPAGGAFGVDLWRPDQVVRDSFETVVPRDAAPGYYRVEIRMNRSPHYPNLRLADYFFERDYYSGVPMSVIEVVRTRADLGRPPAPLPAEFRESH